MGLSDKRTTVLGLETSCDETAVAIVSSSGEILANQIFSQFDEHSAFGGVVPEIAARAHVEKLDHLIEAALTEADMTLNDIDAIAATSGPGLIGAIMVGSITGKSLALAANKPFLAINHLEGHALSPRLSNQVPYPYLLLLISGGHCQLIHVEGLGHYTRLGTTIDDAAGEAFDKAAKILGLPVPGGPNLEKAAKGGDVTRFDLPRPLIKTKSADFSFSGLKTALMREIQKLTKDTGCISQQDQKDLSACFQDAITDCLVDRCAHAMEKLQFGTKPKHFVVAGGVAANAVIRSRLEQLAEINGYIFTAPPLWLCTDNGAMIAWAGVEHFAAGHIDNLDTPARPRWPLDQLSQSKLGSGKKGAKA